jgi:hypothetical protein
VVEDDRVSEGAHEFLESDKERRDGSPASSRKQENRPCDTSIKTDKN